MGHVEEGDFYDVLPDDEADDLISSIRHYTDDYNWTLEDENEVNNLNKMIDSAKKLHWNDGELYRGINVDQEFLDALNEGDIIETGLPSSWTSDGEVAFRFATGEHLENENGIQVVLVDKTEGERNAVSIMDFSRYQDEQEVLYSGDSSFKILEIREEENMENGGAIFMVDVEEVRK